MIHNTDHYGYIEIDLQVICLMPEVAVKTFVLPKFTASGAGTLREVNKIIL